jgi:hypothetical protein
MLSPNNIPYQQLPLTAHQHHHNILNNLATAFLNEILKHFKDSKYILRLEDFQKNVLNTNKL